MSFNLLCPQLLGMLCMTSDCKDALINKNADAPVT